MYFAAKFVETKLLYQSVCAFLVLVDAANYFLWRFYRLAFTPVMCTHTLVNKMCYQICLPLLLLGKKWYLKVVFNFSE